MGPCIAPARVLGTSFALGIPRLARAGTERLNAAFPRRPTPEEGVMTFAELQSVTECHQQAVEFSANQALDDPAYMAWCAARRTAWMTLLTGSFMFYYLLMKMHEALTLL